MNSTTFICDWLNRMVDRFDWIKFKYEFKDGRHQLAVFPQNIVENSEEYCREENLFYDTFVDTYPDDDLYIGIEEKFFTCSEKNVVVFETVKL